MSQPLASRMFQVGDWIEYQGAAPTDWRKGVVSAVLEGGKRYQLMVGKREKTLISRPARSVRSVQYPRRVP